MFSIFDAKVHARIAFCGSAVVAGLLAAVFDRPSRVVEPQYAYVDMGESQCLVDVANDVMATGVEAELPCVPKKPQ